MNRRDHVHVGTAFRQGQRIFAVAAAEITKSWTRLKRLHFHFSLSCIGEGYGNPLQQLETKKCGEVQKFAGLRALDDGVDGENNKAFLQHSQIN